MATRQDSFLRSRIPTRASRLRGYIQEILRDMEDLSYINRTFNFEHEHGSAPMLRSILEDLDTRVISQIREDCAEARDYDQIRDRAPSPVSPEDVATIESVAASIQAKLKG